MPRFTGKVHVPAPIEEAWRVTLQTGAGNQDNHDAPRKGGKMPFGVESISYTPELPTLTPGMKVTLNLGMFGLRESVIIRIDEVNDDEYYFGTSVIKAPFNVRGDTKVSFTPDQSLPDESDLSYDAHLNLPFIAQKLLPIGKIHGAVDSMIMPNVAGMIAKRAQRSRD